MYFRKTKEETLFELGTRAEGLTSEQVQGQREKYGRNQLEEIKNKTLIQVFLSQFADLLVIILIVAAGVSVLTDHVESTIVILFVITMNAVLGTVQHVKAEQSLKSLKELSAPMAKVIRDDVRKEIDAREIVVGDIILMEAGDIVPADGRIIQNYSMQVNESALTGESVAVNKIDELIDQEEVSLGDQKNMVFSSSLVTYGRGLICVTAVGMSTELGRIATLMIETKERKTPLQVSLDTFSKRLSFIIMVICAAVFAVNVLRDMPILDSLMFAVALAVAAIPEALSSIVTISLAIGTSKMAKENAIIKNLRAVEGLGCVSIICSDKTGTLTQNKMTVKHTYAMGTEKSNKLMLASILCNDSDIVEGRAMGDPTETALTQHYYDNYNDIEEKLATYKRLAELPFDSERKLMSTVHQVGEELVMVSKGAVDVLLDRIAMIYDNEVARPVTEEDIEKIKEINHEYSSDGLRVLGFARRVLDSTSISLESEHNFTFIGMIAMVDPPRPESAKAVSDCRLAGIKPIMITGDHKITASAIAKEIGIFQEGDLALTGLELSRLSDEELIEQLPNISVYARVSPEHKIRIVEMWQRQGHIVAMTGDGVNDAPALKKADIGIAMGITGTAVSKDAASMVLTDDNFATIIKSVTNGRTIYANIKNSIKFLLSGNTSGILAVLYTSILALPMPFMAVHLLFINLLTDSLPAIAIAMEKSNGDLLKEKPRDSAESILTKDFLLGVGVQGSLIGVFTLVAYYAGLETSAAMASTMAFATLCWGRLWHGFNSRGKSSIFRLGFFTNPYSVGAFVLGTLLLAAVMLVPALQGLFLVTPLGPINLAIIAGCAISPTVIIQSYRLVTKQ